MTAFLSPAWLEAAAAALAADDALARATAGVHLVLQQTVTAGTDGEPDTTWHVRFDDGTVSLVAGEAPDPTATFTCDRATAVAVHEGRTSAQVAFMAGQLRLGGDTGALLRHQALLAGLTDVLAPLRAAAG